MGLLTDRQLGLQKDHQCLTTVLAITLSHTWIQKLGHIQNTDRVQSYLAEEFVVGLVMAKLLDLAQAIRKPGWLEALNTQRFFVGCSTHENGKKNEKNICCLDCCTSICPHCLPSHRFHRLLQVRRYVYHDVVRLEDLEKLIDCSNVQAYTINSAKVVFIKKRPQSRQFKGSGNYCTTCDRSLQEPYIHCSLGCKVEFLLKHNNDLSGCLRTCKTLQLNPDFLAHQDIGDDDTNHSTVVDDDDAMGSSSGSENLSLPCTDFGRKKRCGPYVCVRSATSMSDDDMATSISRRKGIPHRSPLC
ncbi:protein RGF1 INDUCIBLE TRANSCRIPTION FACTOR 1-like [Aristolochia californica]|uniref:protein RGF1 INDUCIBLE TRANSCRIPTION FACTOR 1-like n=1 Tax=Aristolochia californica TaxID=171875 RepID=UPI0035E3304A